MENTIEFEYGSDSSISTYSEWAADPPNKKYKCTYENCDKAFYRPSKLENHKRVHTGEKPFKCELSDCDKCYHRKDLLKKHQEQAHLRNIKYVECTVCQLKMRQNSLRKHMLRKHNCFRKWKYQCEECDKGFRNENELSNHLNEHSPIFRCDTCNKDFKKGYLFRKHMKYHKDYECLCKKKISGHNNFRAHKKNCEFTRPICNICSQTFSTKSSFKEHLKIVHNTGNHEIFTCTIEGCNKQYNRKRNYNFHVSKIHGQKVEEEERLVCAVCSLILKNKVNLWRHMKTVHINENKKKSKPRKPRCDKNIPKVPMLTRLTGIRCSEEKGDGCEEVTETQPPVFVVVKEEPRDEEEIERQSLGSREEEEEMESQSSDQSEEEEEPEMHSAESGEDERMEIQSQQIVSEFLQLLSQERSEREEIETAFQEIKENEEVGTISAEPRTHEEIKTRPPKSGKDEEIETQSPEGKKISMESSELRGDEEIETQSSEKYFETQSINTEMDEMKVQSLEPTEEEKMKN